MKAGEDEHERTTLATRTPPSFPVAGKNGDEPYTPTGAFPRYSGSWINNMYQSWAAPLEIAARKLGLQIQPSVQVLARDGVEDAFTATNTSERMREANIRND